MYNWITAENFNHSIKTDDDFFEKMLTNLPECDIVIMRNIT